MPQQPLGAFLVECEKVSERMSQAEKRKRGGTGTVISDPRFVKLHTDARFQVFPNKQRKIEIDERFKGVPSIGLQIAFGPL